MRGLLKSIETAVHKLQLDELIIALIFELDESKDDIEFSQFGFIISREVSWAKSGF